MLLGAPGIATRSKGAITFTLPLGLGSIKLLPRPDIEAEIRHLFAMGRDLRALTSGNMCGMQRGYAEVFPPFCIFEKRILTLGLFR